MRTILSKMAVLVGFVILFSGTANAVERNTYASDNQPEILLKDKNPQKVQSNEKTVRLTFKQKIKLLKEIRAERKKMRKMGIKEKAPMVLLYILAVLLPPVAVGIYTNWEAKPTLIDLLLTLIFWLPGVVYAFYILLS